LKKLPFNIKSKYIQKFVQDGFENDFFVIEHRLYFKNKVEKLLKIVVFHDFYRK